ncbi:MAG: DUF4347 domain-containing protein [Cyanobacteriota bacterium]|nr:DUF4347 domain-containing protein [Cyanobacteriota bacterium]
MMTRTSLFQSKNSQLQTSSVSGLLRQFSQHLDTRSPSHRTLVFIDERVSAPHILAAGVREGVSVEMVRVDRDGVAQMTDRLREFAAQHGRLDAVHICSHGNPGQLYLGNTTLNTETIASHRNPLKQWRQFLAPNANLLLYGCEVAAGEGFYFVRQLSWLTGAKIAASVDRTGSVANGGTWNLDFTTGQITEPLAFTPEIIATYAGTFAIFTVSNNDDSGAGSLREAIANANSGDTIQFDPSLANQTITLTSGEITVGVGKDITIDGSGADNLTISGNNASRIFRIRSTSVNPTDITIANLNLTKGYTAEQGGAIVTEHQTKLIIDNVDFTNNTADDGGGAIFSAFEGRLTVSDSRFEGNEATAGNDERGAGAIGFRGPDRLTITNSDFIDNRGIVGGAVNSLNGELIVENSRFINNNTLAATFDTGETRAFLRGYGGAIYTDRASTRNPDTSGTIRITDSVFEGNSGRAAGGAAYFFTDPRDRVIIEGSTFDGNESKALEGGDGEGGNAGAVIVLTDSGETNRGLTIENTTFANNTAAQQGGALWLMRTPTTITNTVLSSNEATNNFGGAMAIYEAPIEISYTTIANNQAQFSGAFSQNDPNLATVSNTIFANNTSNELGVSFNNNPQTNRPINDGGNNIQSPGDPAIAPGITQVDPQLGPLQVVDGVLVHPLQAGSPAIDAGANSGVTTDRRGATRPQDGDLNGSAIADIGAFEFGGTTDGGNGGGDDDGRDGGGDGGDGGDGGGDGGSDGGDGGSDGGSDGGDMLPADDSPCETIVKPTLPNIEQLLVELRQGDDDALQLGTLQDDFLSGDGQPDIIFGDEGSDAILGGGNNDILVGGDGADDGSTGEERDVLYGNFGNDTLSGGIDNDLLRGGQGNDLAYADDGDDWVWGDLGDDTLSGGDGNDVVVGGSGTPTNGQSDLDLMFGGAGDDAMLGNTGSDTMYGENGNDIMAAGQGADLLFGEAGEDVLYGDKGNDTVCGGEGNDLLIGGNGSPIAIGADGEQDRLCGGEGNDTVLGNEGADTLSGDAGNDALFGGKDNDLIFGGVGNDRLSGDGGNDSLSGGDGSDRFSLATGKGTDTIVDFVVGEDTIELTGGLTFAQLTLSQSGNDTTIALTSTDEVLATLTGINSTAIDGASFATI